MTLGHAGNPNWRDMSDYLVHFVGGLDATDESRTALLHEVMHEGALVAGDRRVGLGYGWNMPTHSARCVCLSEIPLDLLDRLIRRRGPFGVAVYREFVRQRGGNRVWYVDEGSEAHTWFTETLQWVAENRWWDHDLWRVVRYIDPVIRDGERRNEWDWEREWRVPDRLDFVSTDVRFLFAPDAYHEQLKSDLGAVALIDPRWPEMRLVAALSAATGTPPTPA